MEVVAAHEDDDGSAGTGQGVPIYARLGLVRVLVAENGDVASRDELPFR